MPVAGLGAMASEAVAAEFRKMADKYKWDEAVSTWCLSTDGLGAQSMEDFIHCVEDPEKLSDIVKAAGIKEVGNAMRQSSRVRQAWVALKKAAAEMESVKRRGIDEADMDTMLPQTELDDMSKKHYVRYEMTWPPEVAPGDMLVSRISKELTKRLLGVADVWKIKTQAMQLKATRKKTKVGELELTYGETENGEQQKDMAKYLNLLLALLIAYSMAGIEAIQGAPQDTRGSDTTKVVWCPLDVVMRYYYRAQNKAMQIGGYAGLDW